MLLAKKDDNVFIMIKSKILLFFQNIHNKFNLKKNLILKINS